MEFHALRAAFDAGVRVPEPYFLYENVLFMELIVDAAGAPASRLADFTFTAEEATALHQEVFLQVKALLGTGRIHGDLSAYNVLMAAGGPTIIDMPQVVEVAGNNNARQILRRDLRNVTEHLARFDARLLRVADCGDALFHHLQRGTLGHRHRARGGGARAPHRRRWGQRASGPRRRAGSRRPRQEATPRRQRADGETRRADAPGKAGRADAPGKAGGPTPHAAAHPGDQARGYVPGAGPPRVEARTGGPSHAGPNHHRRRGGR